MMGCNAQVGDFVKGGGEKLVDPILPQIDTGGSYVKLTNAKGLLGDSHVTMSVTLSPTKQVLSSTVVSGEFSISRNRPALQ